MTIKVLVVSVFIGFQAHALEHGCELHPSQLAEVATRVVKSYAAENKSVPDSLLIQSNVEGSFSNDGSDITASAEGFFRPSEDGYFSLWNLPLLGFELSRARNMIYICAHIDPDASKSHITVYFLRGYHVDPTRLSTIIGDILSEPKFEVRPIPMTAIGTGTVRNTLLKLLGSFPEVIRKYSVLRLLGGVQRLFANVISDFSGIGVEKIEVTEDYFTISSKVNLNNPSEALISKTISLKSKNNSND